MTLARTASQYLRLGQCRGPISERTDADAVLSGHLQAVEIHCLIPELGTLREPGKVSKAALRKTAPLSI